MMVLGAKQTNGNKVPLFDAPYSTYTGINDLSVGEESEVSLYPNPASSFISVESDQPGELTIMDLKGNK